MPGDVPPPAIVAELDNQDRENGFIPHDSYPVAPFSLEELQRLVLKLQEACGKIFATSSILFSPKEIVLLRHILSPYPELRLEILTHYEDVVQRDPRHAVMQHSGKIETAKPRVDIRMTKNRVFTKTERANQLLYEIHTYLTQEWLPPKLERLAFLEEQRRIARLEFFAELRRKQEELNDQIREEQAVRAAVREQEKEARALREEALLIRAHWRSTLEVFELYPDTAARAYRADSPFGRWFLQLMNVPELKQYFRFIDKSMSTGEIILERLGDPDGFPAKFPELLAICAQHLPNADIAIE